MRAPVFSLLRSALLLLAMTAEACSDSKPPLDKTLVCTGSWQALTSAVPYDITSPLVYRDGVLYYSTALIPKIVALSVAGGAESTLASVFASELWVEGDHLLYVSGSNLVDQFFSLPLNGGSPQLLLDGGAGRTTPGFSQLHAFSAADFFWTEVPLANFDGPTTVWRASRSGGTPTQIGSISASTAGGTPLGFAKMALSNDSVLLASMLGIADVVPFDGSPTRSLATVDALTKGAVQFAGIDGAGVYWSIPRPGTPTEDDASTVMLAPADGSPVRSFWQGLPAHSVVDQMWPDGAGGWVIAALQLFDDQQFHHTIWLLGADGTGRRLACSPDRFVDVTIRVRPVLTPDAVFAIVVSDTWQIVRIPR